MRGIKMKKVIMESAPSNHTVKVNNLDHLIQKYNYIGFEESGLCGERYFIVTRGPAMGFAVNPEGTFTSKNLQYENQKEGYFVFETQEELFDWMLRRHTIKKGTKL
jgi:hypothetical protein